MLGLLLFAVALGVLRHQLREYHLHEVVADVARLGGRDVSLAVGLTALSYLLLTGYDVLGAASPTSPGNFSTVGQTVGLETCWVGNPSSTYLKVVARGPGGQGP